MNIFNRQLQYTTTTSNMYMYFKIYFYLPLCRLQ